MPTFQSLVLLLILSVFLSGCASTQSKKSPIPASNYVSNERFNKIADSKTNRDKDRAAILAMQGEYKVTFDFKETVILQDKYERFPIKNSGAFETVVVLEDSPEKISFQHILVTDGGHVVKHWRQDWFYEAKKRFEFIANQTWEIKPIATNKQKGHWTQCVYEVSDAPRYCGTGRWNHKYGVSTWTSDRTWRPLPRREYTVRNDYNALNVENRHTVTPLGWTHEQDNTKTLRENGKTVKTLVREFGFNDYRRIEGFDFSPAYEYWDKTKNYWQSVRNTWDKQFKKSDKVVLNTEVDGMPIIMATFGHADFFMNPEPEAKEPTRQDIDKIFTEWVSSVDIKNKN